MPYNEYDPNNYSYDVNENADPAAAPQPDGAYSYSYVQPRQYTAPRPDPVMEPAPKKKRKLGWLKVTALCLSCAILGAAAGFGVVYLSPKPEPAAPSSGQNTVVLGPQKQEDTEDASGVVIDRVESSGSTTAADVYRNNLPSCVGIETTSTTTNVFGQTVSGAVAGSGFVISEDGYIATNYHVIMNAIEGDSSVTVMFQDGSEYSARVVGGEEANDIAVLKIEAEGLRAVSFADSDDLSVGDQVYAIGNPLGELTYTMTGGMVSALDRVISTDVSTSINMFQMDAAVNSGNSGGPVFNASGDVVGVVTAKYQSTGVEGLGFAVPINDALEIIEELIEHGYVTGKPFFGMMVRTVDATTAQYYNLAEGVMVDSVNPGGAAERAGLRRGDIITALDGQETLDIAELDSVTANYRAGDTVELTVYRNGQTISITLTFDEKLPTN